MSHFVLHIIVPKNLEIDQVEDIISQLMEPFDENIEVDPYETECYCVNSIASIEARRQAQQELGKTLNELREEYWNMPEESRPEWNTYIQPYKELVDKKEKEHPLYQKPDPNCETCQGAGKRETTYNPNSKWDWYVIGGRWNGWLTSDNDTSPYIDDIENNLVDVSVAKEKAIQEDKTPFAVLTPDGKWHEKGEMMMFAMVKDEMPEDEWKALYLNILDQYPDHQVVVVDCHI